MQIILNKEKEIKNVSVISEKKVSVENQNFRGIVINVVDSEYDVAETEELFQNIISLEAVRNKEDGEVIALDYSKDNKLTKIERKITDDIDTTIITIISED